MLERYRWLWPMVAGCSGAPSPAQTVQEIKIDAPLAASSLPALGVTEVVSGPTGAERNVRAQTANVGACLRSTLEREPDLRGTLTFRIEGGTPVKGGTLASLPAAACIQTALRNVKSDAPIVYSLTLGGYANPSPLRPGALLSEEWVIGGWNTAVPERPGDFAQVRSILMERFRRCAFAAEPFLTEEVWVSARVANGGSVTDAVGRNPGERSEAFACIERAARSTKFPNADHDYAFSVVLRPEVADAEADPSESVAEARAAALEEAAEFGMVSGLEAGEVNILGDLDGVAGGGVGLGGLGLPGLGRGDVQIGLIGGSGLGTGSGFGVGSGKGGLGRRAPPRVSMGTTNTTGQLPPEIIQRIVRQNFGRYRLCYENGLRRDPALAGKISIRFKITEEGRTAQVEATSDMKDAEVVACVKKAFSVLSFPQPKGGIVRVTYPIHFSPGDEPAAPAAEATIDGKPIASVSIPQLEQHLLRRKFEVMRVPGSEVPALFIRDDKGLYAITLESQRSGAPVSSRCAVGSKERVLHVQGDGCEDVLKRLLD